MAFERRVEANRKLPLIPLFDMVFLLLLFFLVTQVMTAKTKNYQTVVMQTPENIEGEAQILLQVIDDNRYIWIDEHVWRNIVKQLKAKYGAQLDGAPNRTALYRTEINNIAPLDWDGLKTQINDFKQSAAASNNMRNDELVNYYILVRCPDGFQYGKLLHIIKLMTQDEQGNPIYYIDYGCVGGSWDDVTNATDIGYETIIINGVSCQAMAINLRTN